MPTSPNDVEADATSVRSSILIPAWMEAQIDAEARRTFSSRSQVIRRLVAFALEHAGCEAPVKAAS